MLTILEDYNSKGDNETNEMSDRIGGNTVIIENYTIYVNYQ